MDKKNIVKTRVSTFVLLLLVTASLAMIAVPVVAEQNAVPVSGKVIDSNGNGLAGITVESEDQASVQTDNQGNFAIMMTPGVHTLSFSGSGIEEKDIMINVGDNGLGMGNVSTTKINDSGSNMGITVGLIIAGLLVTGLIVFLFLRRRKK